MKAFLIIFFLAVSPLFSATAPLLTLSDSINPGSADYLISGIKKAEADKAPYVLIQLDTPGGLLNSTRLIVQEMLNAKIPVVVFIGPRGAQAGSAGALITFASDVAAMAPGTNIGAAHPVMGGGEKMDQTMSDKITNDTSAFAESLARAKGRNTSWAIKAVRESASITADEALRTGVIDLMADDVSDLAKKLSGQKLRVAKDRVTQLGPAEPKEVPMTIKQRIVSFFADPNLAYMILTLGGLCIWVELTHPGLIFPGILGAICIIVSLVSFQTMPIHYGALAMIVGGMGLLIAELFLPTYGVLGIGGLLAFIFGSLYLMDTTVPEFQISLSLILPTAGVLAAAMVALGYLMWKTRSVSLRSGTDALIGEFAEVSEAIGDKPGKVFVHGELWNAATLDGTPVAKGAIVVITEVRNMLLVVQPKESL